MSTVRWSDIRDKHIEAIGREDVERGTSRLITQVRAYRFADKRCGLSQREVAQMMGVTVGRVSQIEDGNSPALIMFSPVTSPPSEASLKSSRTSVTNKSRSAEHRC